MSDSALPNEARTNLDQFAAIIREAESLVTPLPEELLFARPTPHRWSAADCLRHLIQANRSYLRKIDRMLATLTDRPQSTGEWRTTFPGRLYARAMRPPVRLRLPAPKKFLPPLETTNKETLLAEFREVHEQIMDRLERVACIDTRGIKVNSPVSRLVRLSFADVFNILAAHDQRHLWQARRAVEAARDGHPS